MSLSRDGFASALEQSLRFVLAPSAPLGRHLLDLLRGRLERGLALGGDSGALGLDRRELGLRLVLCCLRVCVLLLHLGSARLDEAQNRPVQEAVKQPDEDRKVDGLETERPPVEVHR